MTCQNIIDFFKFYEGAVPPYIWSWGLISSEGLLCFYHFMIETGGQYIISSDTMVTIINPDKLMKN